MKRVMTIFSQPIQWLKKHGKQLLTCSLNVISSAANEVKKTFLSEDGNGYTGILENSVEDNTESAIKKYMDAGLSETEAKMAVERIQKAVQESSNTGTGDVDVIALNYNATIKIPSNKAVYFPVTLYNFRNDFYTKTGNYDYLQPVLIYTTISNIKNDTGSVLNIAVTSAYNSTWSKADPSSVMTNLTPCSATNDCAVASVQPVTSELYNSITVREAAEKYEWLKNEENLDLLYKNFFVDEDVGREDTTRNPENRILYKELNREPPKWVAREVLGTYLNGLQHCNNYSGKTSLITGFAIKPDINNEEVDPNVEYPVTVNSTLLVLGTKNQPDMQYITMVTPKDIDIDVPSVDNGKPGVLVTGKQIQQWQIDACNVVYNAKFYPAIIISEQTMQVLNDFQEQITNTKDQHEKDRLHKLMRTGIVMSVPNESDPGFILFEKDP